MPNTQDVACKVIPLYKFTIRCDEKDNYYERVIVADTIEGVIEGIVDMEIDHCEKLDEDRLYFEITDFLYMPCAGAKRGFHLFDIDSVDCAEWYGASTDGEIYYHCYFTEDIRSAPPGEYQEFEGLTFGEPHPVSDVELQPHKAIPYDPDRFDDENAITDAIYRISRNHPYREARMRKQARKNNERGAKAMAKVEKWMDEERVIPMPPVGEIRKLDGWRWRKRVKSK